MCSRAVLIARCLAAVLLGAAGLPCPSIAADDGSANDGSIVLSPSTAAPHPPPELAPGGAVVLRGGHPANPNADQLPRGSSNSGATQAPPLAGGFDRSFDATGFDRRGYDPSGVDRSFDNNYDRRPGFNGTYDSGGFDRSFDRSGLGHP
jgi:hypothetical protein